MRCVQCSATVGKVKAATPAMPASTAPMIMVRLIARQICRIDGALSPIAIRNSSTVPTITLRVTLSNSMTTLSAKIDTVKSEKRFATTNSWSNTPCKPSSVTERIRKRTSSRPPPVAMP